MDIAHPPAHPQLLPHPPATKFDIPSYTTMPLSAHVTFPGETPKWELYQSKARLCTKIKSYKPRIWKSSFRETSSAPLVPGRSGRIWQECNIAKCFRGKMHFSVSSSCKASLKHSLSVIFRSNQISLGSVRGLKVNQTLTYKSCQFLLFTSIPNFCRLQGLSLGSVLWVNTAYN